MHPTRHRRARKRAAGAGYRAKMQGGGASARGGSGAAGRLVGLEPASALFIRVKRRELAECFASLRRAALPASWSLIWPSKVQEQWRCRAAVEQWQRSATLLGKRAMALRKCRWRALQRGWSGWSTCTRLQRHRSALGVLVGEAGRCIRCRWALDAWRENLFRVPVTSTARLATHADATCGVRHLPLGSSPAELRRVGVELAPMELAPVELAELGTGARVARVSWKGAAPAAAAATPRTGSGGPANPNRQWRVRPSPIAPLVLPTTSPLVLPPATDPLPDGLGVGAVRLDLTAVIEADDPEASTP
mgnify:CR=1 FL=1